MPKVSVILTCYNHKEYIGEAIKSIINQTFSDRELLIGDDSPNDETWKIIEGYVSKCPEKIHAWHHEENKGITRNMEFLISKSKGDYIAVLEGDDALYENYLDEKLKIFDGNRKIMLVYNDLDIIDSKSKITKYNYLKKERKIKKFYKGDSFSIEDIFNSYKIPYLSRSSIMFRCEILNNIPIRIDGLSPYNMITDYNFFLIVGSKFKIYGIEKSLTKYRIHDNNTSFKNGSFQLIVELYSLFNVRKKMGIIDDKIRKNMTTRYLIILCYESVTICNIISIKETIKNFFGLLRLKISKLRQKILFD